MPPQSFEYVAARDVDEALAALAEHGEAAAVLAGGQSLVPMMNLRLARPDVVVDINRVADLSHMSVVDGQLRIGALVRHRELEKPVLDDPLAALLARIARHVGHPPIRVRGTFVGSLAHADPAAEWCLVSVALGAQLVLASRRGERVIPADDFFDYPYVTTRRPDELVTSVRLPLLGPRAGVAFREHAATAGGFAQAAATAIVTVENGRMATARVAVGGVGGRPQILPTVQRIVTTEPLADSLLTEVRQQAQEIMQVSHDPLVPADYRRALASELTADVVRDAAYAAGVRWS